MDRLAGLLGGDGGALGVLRDIGNGGGQLLHRAGLLGGALCQGLGAVGHLVGAGGHLVGGLGDIGDGLAHTQDKLVDALLDGGQVAGEHGSELHVEVALGHLAGGAGDVLNHAVEHLLAGAQGVTHLTQLILTGVVDGNRQVALAEAHQSAPDLGAGLHNALDELGSHRQHDQSGHNHHHHNYNNSDGGGQVLLVNNLPLSCLQVLGQSRAGIGGGIQSRGTLIDDHLRRAVSVGLYNLSNHLGLFRPGI